MKTRLVFLFSAIIIFLVSHATFAQKTDINTNKYLPEGIKVDGDLTEWGDSLKSYDPATTLRYDVGNDQTNLYLAIQTSDPVSIRKVLTFGFSFAVNKEAKKKPGPTVTFPVIDHIAVRSAMPKTKPTGRKEDVIKLNQLIISKTNGIRLDKFPEMVDGVISLSNEYGLNGRAVITDSNTLKLELAIPLKMIDIPADFKEAFMYNFRVNGPQRTVLEQGPMRRMGGYGYGYGYGGYGYGEREVYRRTISETKEFWAKYTLSTPLSK